MKQKFFKGIIVCIMIPFFASALQSPEEGGSESDSHNNTEVSSLNVRMPARRSLSRVQGLTPELFAAAVSVPLMEQSSQITVSPGSRIVSTHDSLIQKTNGPGR